jgi:hypothetical protein
LLGLPSQHRRCSKPDFSDRQKIIIWEWSAPPGLARKRDARGARVGERLLLRQPNAANVALNE